MNKKKKRSKKGRRDQLIKGLLLFVVIWFVGSIVLALLSQILLNTMIIGGTVKEEIYETYGFVVSDAYIIESPHTGQATPLTLEGQRVGKNEAVFKVLGSEGTAMQSQVEKVMYAPLSGMVSYKVDNYEDFETIEQIGTLKLSQMHKEMKQVSENNNQAQAGVAYAKIVNNFDDIYLVVPCEINDYTKELELDEKITVRLPEIQLETIGQIIESTKVVVQEDSSSEEIPLEEGALDEQAPLPEQIILPNEDKSTASVPTDKQFVIKINLGTIEQAVLSQRVFMVQLPYKTEQDIVIPNSAIVYKEDKPGVYCVKKGFVSWQSIDIIEQLDKEVVVGNLSKGTEVITTPRIVKEGEKINTKRSVK